MYKIEIKDDELLMKMIKSIINTTNDRKILNRINVILLRRDNKPIKEISKITGLSKRTIINYVKIFNNTSNFDKLDFIKNTNKFYKYKRSCLEDKKEYIKETFENDISKNYKEATNRINKSYNLNLSESAVRRFLIKNKIKIKQKNNNSN